MHTNSREIELSEYIYEEYLENLQLDVFDQFQLIDVLRSPEQYHLLNAKEQYCNILNHRYDMEISFVIHDKSMKIFDNHANDNNN
jgi:hypothetical protein